MPELSSYLKQVASTTKPKEKINFTKNHETTFLLYLLKQMFHPHIKFNLKFKPTDMPQPGGGRIEDFEDEVRKLLSEMSMNFSHKVNLAQAIEIIEQLNEGSQQLLVGVINKKSGAGLSSKGIKKLYPDLWPSWDVQLANPYKEKAKTDLKKEYFWSPKLDGVRVGCCREDGKWAKRSRLANDFETLHHWDGDLEKYYEQTGKTYLDGEAYCHGMPFETIIGKVKRASDPKGAEDLDLYCFVAGDLEGFQKKDPSSFMVNELEFGHICSVHGGRLTIPEAQAKTPAMLEAGFEGIMLRDPDKLYDFKRSDALLKLKLMHSMDCEVIAVLYDDFPVRENGIEKMERMLTNIVVLQENGVMCAVGSGFKLPFRRDVYENAAPVLGCTGQIDYQNLGSEGGMRFPVWIGPRIDK